MNTPSMTALIKNTTISQYHSFNKNAKLKYFTRFSCFARKRNNHINSVKVTLLKKCYNIYFILYFSTTTVSKFFFRTNTFQI